ncbi:hypothetical protein HPB51_029714 [Rhipicephalus microplus]|uniref:Uncharacterized protein n=1 Tax=Rhipicephalus microplus TaxID=6941 RepID=A0A9J6CTI8_RHIMP|nr:hypothetical protein HPB51_029714 [Rhipicephalus microplus]
MRSAVSTAVAARALLRAHPAVYCDTGDASARASTVCDVFRAVYTGGGHRNNFHFGGVTGECDDRRIVLRLWPRCSAVGGLEHMIVAVARPHHSQQLQCRGGRAVVATFPEPSRRGHHRLLFTRCLGRCQGFSLFSSFLSGASVFVVNHARSRARAVARSAAKWLATSAVWVRSAYLVPSGDDISSFAL